MLLCDLLGIDGLLVERLAPAADMAVAPLDGAERRLVEGLDGLAVALFKGDRHHHLEPSGRPVILPGAGEHQPLARNDLAIDAAEPALAAISGLDHPAITAADAQIDRHFWAGETLGPHPALHVLHTRPQSKHNRRWGVEGADDQQLVVSDAFSLGAHYLLLR